MPEVITFQETYNLPEPLSLLLPRYPFSIYLTALTVRITREELQISSIDGSNWPPAYGRSSISGTLVVEDDTRLSMESFQHLGPFNILLPDKTLLLGIEIFSAYFTNTWKLSYLARTYSRSAQEKKAILPSKRFVL